MSSATGPAATLGRLWAVAALTFLEAVRRKVFLIVVIVGAAIVSSAAFLPSVDPEGRLRLVEIWSIRTVTVFCSLGAIFLAGFSLPGDFEHRRIYTLVTKPIHKGTLFLGKFLGFFLLMAVFLAIMGVITLGYLKVIAAVSPDFPEARVYPRHFAAAMFGPLEEKEKGGKGIRADQPGFLEFEFRDLPAGRFPEKVHARGRLNLNRFPDMQFRLVAEVQVVTVNPKTRDEHSQVIRFKTNSPIDFEIPGRLVSDEGGLLLRMRPDVHEVDLLIGAWPEQMSIRSDPVSFDVNFMKGMILVLLQSSLVLLATLSASTFVSAPVSILLGICLFLTGTAWSFVTESLETVDLRLRDIEKRQKEGGPTQAEEIPPWMLRVSGVMSRAVLEAVPDFDAYDFGTRLLTDTSVSARDLGRALAAFAPRAAILLLIGLVLISFRDFAT